MGAGAKAGVTSGGADGTSGAPVPLWRRPALLALAAFAGFGLVYLVVNATSLIDERRALGRPIEAWKPWLWEATSYLGWLILLPGVLWLAAHLARGPLWRALAGHALAFPLASIVHTGLMIGMRHLGYWPTGEPYTLSGPLGDVLVYELRKDVITYGSVVLAYLVLRRLAVPAELPAPAAPPPPRGHAPAGPPARWRRPPPRRSSRCATAAARCGCGPTRSTGWRPPAIMSSCTGLSAPSSPAARSPKWRPS